MTRKEQIHEAEIIICTHTRPTGEIDNGEFITEYSYDQIEGIGFRAGAEWADAHPYHCWKNYKDEKPEEGVEVIAYNKAWINEDFNPNGTRVGFLNGDGEFTSAYWWDYQDCYETISKSDCEEDKEFYSQHIDNTEPEFWLTMPKYSYK